MCREEGGVSSSTQDWYLFYYSTALLRRHLQSHAWGESNVPVPTAKSRSQWLQRWWETNSHNCSRLILFVSLRCLLQNITPIPPNRAELWCKYISAPTTASSLTMNRRACFQAKLMPEKPLRAVQPPHSLCLTASRNDKKAKQRRSCCTVTLSRYRRVCVCICVSTSLGFLQVYF